MSKRENRYANSSLPYCKEKDGRQCEECFCIKAEDDPHCMYCLNPWPPPEGDDE